MDNPSVPAAPAHEPARVRGGNAIPRPAELPATFRAIAASLRQYGADDSRAAIWELAAEMLEESQRQFGLELLTLPQAEAESGYTRDHLGRLVDEDRIPNASAVAGSKAILRMHLPRKPGHGVEHGVAPMPAVVPSSRLQAARAVAGRED